MINIPYGVTHLQWASKVATETLKCSFVVIPSYGGLSMYTYKMCMRCSTRSELLSD